MDKFGCNNKSVVKPLFDLGYTLFWCTEQRGRFFQFKQLSYDNLSNNNEKNSLAFFLLTPYRRPHDTKNCTSELVPAIYQIFN